MSQHNQLCAYTSVESSTQSELHICTTSKMLHSVANVPVRKRHYDKFDKEPSSPNALAY